MGRWKKGAKRATPPLSLSIHLPVCGARFSDELVVALVHNSRGPPRAVFVFCGAAPDDLRGRKSPGGMESNEEASLKRPPATARRARIDSSERAAALFFCFDSAITREHLRRFSLVADNFLAGGRKSEHSARLIAALSSFLRT